MKKKVIILSLNIFVGSIVAQTSDSTKNKSTFKKNEISINTAPVLKQLLTNGEASATRFSFSYKRNINEKSALRFSIVADQINNEAFNHHNAGRDLIILNSDSVLIRQETISPGFISPHLNIGYERLFGKGKLKWFYGADLTLGYSENETFRQNIILHKDSIQGSYGWSENQNHPEIISRSHTKTVSIGVSPFWGAKYPISKRFSISAQVGVDAVFRDQRVSERGVGFNKNAHFSSFDFNLDTGFLNDISIIYKF
jgi:hypothetical protein